jgi:7-alpha-hydroxysteroid dehydrogenase
LSPSQPNLTPGLSYYRTDFDETGSAEAAVRLALVDPNSVTGRTIGHVDVLNGSFRPFEVTAAALG